MDPKVDADLRCATAVACRVGQVLLELTLADGRAARVSHDRAFRPIMPPCALRRALVTPARPRWLGAAQSVALRGPFVEIDPILSPGIVTFPDGPAARAVFATTAPPCVVACWLRSSDPPMVDPHLIEGTVGADAELGTTLIDLTSTGLDTEQVRDVAHWIARAGPVRHATS